MRTEHEIKEQLDFLSKKLETARNPISKFRLEGNIFILKWVLGVE